MMHGLLLLDKPSEWTSHDVVARLRKILGQREIGHTGTLDPFASGLMIMVLGEATKISDYLRDAEKSYRAKIQLGLTTDTLDRTGETLRQVAVELDEAEISRSASELVGEFQWQVPRFSAVKRNGQKLCDQARAGVDFVVPTKQMRFDEVQVVNVTRDMVEVTLTCSSGSYVRTWVDQLGLRLGCGATTMELRRLTTAGFAIDQAITLQGLERLEDREDLKKNGTFIPLNAALPGLPGVVVKDRDEQMLINGTVSFDLSRRLNPLQREVYSSGAPVTIKVLSGKSGRLLSLIEVKPAEGVKVRRVFRQVEPDL